MNYIQKPSAASVIKELAQLEALLERILETTAYGEGERFIRGSKEAIIAERMSQLRTQLA